MRYWLSFDLGLRGEYEDLYMWLDAMEARECGENVATFLSEKTGEQIKTELSDILDERARVYIITRKQGGRFILGKRKRAPWSGYAQDLFDVEMLKALVNARFTMLLNSTIRSPNSLISFSMG